MAIEPDGGTTDFGCLRLAGQQPANRVNRDRLGIHLEDKPRDSPTGVRHPFFARCDELPGIATGIHFSMAALCQYRFAPTFSAAR
jgi:hypothetical protein